MLYMKATGKKGKEKEKELKNTLTVIHMKDNGKII